MVVGLLLLLLVILGLGSGLELVVVELGVEDRGEDARRGEVVTGRAVLTEARVLLVDRALGRAGVGRQRPRGHVVRVPLVRASARHQAVQVVQRV